MTLFAGRIGRNLLNDPLGQHGIQISKGRLKTFRLGKSGRQGGKTDINKRVLEEVTRLVQDASALRRQIGV